MLIWVVIKVALKSLWASKLRSFLAMLGIIIGVGAVIAMLALGAGTQKQVLSRITAMGANLLILRPGNRGAGGVMSGTQQNMTIEDAQAIVAELPLAKDVAPVVGGNSQLKYMNKNSRTSVTGTSPNYFSMRNFEIEFGRAFTEAESEQMARVVILGPVTVDTLFGKNDPIGETVKLAGINFKVIGVLKAKGDSGFFNTDDQAIVPYTIAMKQLYGARYLREIDIQTVDGGNVSDLQDQVTALIRKRHRLVGNAPDDFNIRNQAEIQETVTNTNRMFTFLLGGIAGISLLVGGIGIMNIMLVTVTERTREIGVRKAIGAKERDILGQFLLEAVLMSGVGGVLGVAAGYGGAELLQYFMGTETIVESSSVIMSLGFSAGVGILFGVYPAMRAAQLDPIEALRYE